VTDREIHLFTKHIELQNRLFSLKLSAHSIGSIIEARQTNIVKRATQISEFKKETPKKQSLRFHRTRHRQENHSIVD